MSIYYWVKPSGTAPRFAGAHAVVLSVGKSGRTWLRVLLNKYLSLRYGVEFDIKSLGEVHEGIPSIVFTHELWTHRSTASLKERLTGTHIIPNRYLFDKKVVLLARDPRDVVVSMYFQATRRSGRDRDRIGIPMGEFIRHPRLGMAMIVDVMNEWRRRLVKHPSLYLIRYEDMHSDPVRELERLLEFLDPRDMDRGCMERAVAFASFENMRRMEASGEFERKTLKPADPSDPDSYKVRKGRVGAFVEHFTAEELAYLGKETARLDPWYGYGAP